MSTALVLHPAGRRDDDEREGKGAAAATAAGTAVALMPAGDVAGAATTATATAGAAPAGAASTALLCGEPITRRWMFSRSWVYVLQLANNKFYVGYSERGFHERVREHVDGFGAAWTRLHPPRMLMQWRPGTKADETAITLEMMRAFGYQNVRGAQWVEVTMLRPPVELMSEADRQVYDKVARVCDRVMPSAASVSPPHASKPGAGSGTGAGAGAAAVSPGKSVAAAGSTDGTALVPAAAAARTSREGAGGGGSGSGSGAGGSLAGGASRHWQQYDACYRCGRAGHWVSTCCARTNALGQIIIDGVMSAEGSLPWRGRPGSTAPGDCLRCGGAGHFSTSDCPLSVL